MAETIIGLDKLQRKLKKLEKPDKALHRGLRNYYQDGSVQGRAEKYAPASSANFPPAPYYVRGTGTFTGRKNNRKSQKMSNRWKWQLQTMGGQVRLLIQNLATYSGFVIGDKQARFHAARGWEKTQAVIDDTLDRAVREIAKEIDRILKE